MKLEDTYTWVIREVREEAPSVKSFILEAEGERPDFISGQYLTVHLKDFEPAEGKSYSISSGYGDEFVRLTVKEAGPFSRALSGHRVGDTLTTGAPYGFFYPEEDAHDIVFVAGGIGITPVMSIIETLARRGHDGALSLFYSNRTHGDITFRETLESLEREAPNLHIFHHITREPVNNERHRIGRITGASVLNSLPEDTRSVSDYFICGSIDFTKSMWRELKEAGVPVTQLYTEGFY